MTLFEYLAVAFGLLFTMAAMRLLGGLPHALSKERRYWIHLGVTLLMLLGCAAVFWTFWSLKDVDWTFPRFLVALAIPGTLYYCCAALVPENPEEVRSWRAHYWDVRTRFWGGVVAWITSAAVSASVNLGMGLTHPARGFHVFVAALGIVGVTSSSERVHSGLVVTMAVVGLGLAFTVAAAPAWLAR
jgi:hypothetical protein